MKTFHSVPPQSTSVQRTVCIQYWMSKVQIEAKSQSSSPPDSQLLPRTPHSVHTAAASPLLHPAEDTTRCPPALPCPGERLEASEECPAPLTRGRVTVLREPAVPPHQYQVANSCTVVYTTTWSTIQYSQVTIYITPQHQESTFFSDAKCYFTHAAKNSKTSSTKEFIWLLRTNKLAGLFQVSFGSMLKYHDLSSSGFRKGVWLWA